MSKNNGFHLFLKIVNVLFYRPMIVIGGSSDRDQDSMGAFQEYPQVG